MLLPSFNVKVRVRVRVSIGFRVRVMLSRDLEAMIMSISCTHEARVRNATDGP